MMRPRGDSSGASASRPTLQALVALSCFGGDVGASSLGDSHDAIAALQDRELRWIIVCLAPKQNWLARPNCQPYCASSADERPPEDPLHQWHGGMLRDGNRDLPPSSTCRSSLK